MRAGYVSEFRRTLDRIPTGWYVRGMTIVPNLWFDGDALEAAEFSVSVFPDSSINAISRYPESGMGKTGSVR